MLLPVFPITLTAACVHEVEIGAWSMKVERERRQVVGLGVLFITEEGNGHLIMILYHFII